jgi:hypothetical protein
MTLAEILVALAHPVPLLVGIGILTAETVRNARRILWLEARMTMLEGRIRRCRQSPSVPSVAAPETHDDDEERTHRVPSPPATP